MPDLPDLPSRLRRPPRVAERGDWYRIEAKADSKTAEVWIYDDIGFFGTNAKDFGAELRAITADEITLHLNTLGGDAFEGIAIYNALKDHPAKVTVIVDALAASAGSFIAQAGDVIRMNRGAQMMIHDAGGLVMGNAADMQDVAATLDKVSDSIAGIYAARVGGTVAEWRKAMRAESWYTAAEAVEVGLADEMVDDPAAPTANNKRDLSIFAYAGRTAAPPPILNRRPDPPTPRKPPEAPAASGASSYPNAKEGAGMDPVKIREALGLPGDASDDQVRAALTSAGLGTSPTTPPDPEPAPEPTPTSPATPAAPAPKQELVHAAGTMTIDASAWQEREDRIKRLEAADAKRRISERDQIIANAVVQGKFPPARREHWVRLWDADPEGTRQVIAGLAPNVVSVMASGYDGDLEGENVDAEFEHLFPPTPARKGA